MCRTTHNIPSSWSVADCERFFTEYISTALMMGGSAELWVFMIENWYFPLGKTDGLYKVTVLKYEGTKDLYQSLPSIVTLDDLNWLAFSITISAKCK